MFCGVPARSLDDITRLRRTRFDFGEIVERALCEGLLKLQQGPGKTSLLPEKIGAVRKMLEYSDRNTVVINLRHISRLRHLFCENSLISVC